MELEASEKALTVVGINALKKSGRLSRRQRSLSQGLGFGSKAVNCAPRSAASATTSGLAA